VLARERERESNGWEMEMATSTRRSGPGFKWRLQFKRFTLHMERAASNQKGRGLIASSFRILCERGRDTGRLE
jgi:hypothetical protein